METVDRRWVCLATLGPIGVACLVYVVVIRGFVDVDEYSDHGLAWPLLGALPLFVFGMWLLTVSASRVAMFVALGATALIAGSAYETFMREPRGADGAVVPLLQRDRPHLGCAGDVRAPGRLRDLPRRCARAPLAADRGHLPLDSAARGSSPCSRPRTS